MVQRLAIAHRFEQGVQKMRKALQGENVRKNRWQRVGTLLPNRENGLLSFSRIGHKIFYKPEDVKTVGIVAPLTNTWHILSAFRRFYEAFPYLCRHGICFSGRLAARSRILGPVFGYIHCGNDRVAFVGRVARSDTACRRRPVDVPSGRDGRQRHRGDDLLCVGVVCALGVDRALVQG